MHLKSHCKGVGPLTDQDFYIFLLHLFEVFPLPGYPNLFFLNIFLIISNFFTVENGRYPKAFVFLLFDNKIKFYKYIGILHIYSMLT